MLRPQTVWPKPPPSGVPVYPFQVLFYTGQRSSVPALLNSETGSGRNTEISNLAPSQLNALSAIEGSLVSNTDRHDLEVKNIS